MNIIPEQLRLAVDKVSIVKKSDKTKAVTVTMSVIGLEEGRKAKLVVQADSEQGAFSVIGKEVGPGDELLMELGVTSRQSKLTETKLIEVLDRVAKKKGK